MQKIGGAVERINDPPVFGFGRGDRGAGFLGQNAMLGIAFANRVDDGVFSGPIDFGNEIVGGLALNRQFVEIAGRAVDDGARTAGLLVGGGKQWMDSQISLRAGLSPIVRLSSR